MPERSPSTALPARRTYDAIVVGARAAGAATAMLLARDGLRTLVLDDCPAGSDAMCARVLLRGAVRQLSRWGLLDQITATGTPPVTRTTHHYADESVTISFRRSPGVDALYAPRRAKLDRVLLEAAMHAGADVCFGTTVNGPVMSDGRVVGVHATTNGGRFLDLRAPLVVGADGIRSTIARRVASTTSRQGDHASAMTLAHWSDVAVDGYHLVFRPNGCAGFVPTCDGQVCVFVSATPDRIGRGGVGVIRDIVAAGSPELAATLDAAPPPTGVQTWTGHRSYLRRGAGAGWALVGDAGCYTDPLGLHGLTAAFRDAELLARAVRGDDLGEYEQTRDCLTHPIFDVVDRIASHQWDDDEIAALQLRLISAMTDEVDALSAA